MTDEQFHKLATTFGFVPSRALRELLDAATGQARTEEREACARVCERDWIYTASSSEMALCIRERGKA